MYSVPIDDGCDDGDDDCNEGEGDEDEDEDELAIASVDRGCCGNNGMSDNCKSCSDVDDVDRLFV